MLNLHRAVKRSTWDLRPWSSHASCDLMADGEAYEAGESWKSFRLRGRQ